MSYCRWGPDSDVYLFMAADNQLHCCACRLTTPGFREDFFTDKYSEMLSHLEQHNSAGHLVPDEAIQELVNESDEFRDEAPNLDPRRPVAGREQ